MFICNNSIVHPALCKSIQLKYIKFSPDSSPEMLNGMLLDCMGWVI